MEAEDKLLVKETESTVKLLFDPVLCEVVETKGNRGQVMLRRRDKNIKRSFNKVKVVKEARRRKEKVTGKEASEMDMASDRQWG